MKAEQIINLQKCKLKTLAGNSSRDEGSDLGNRGSRSESKRKSQMVKNYFRQNCIIDPRKPDALEMVSQTEDLRTKSPNAKPISFPIDQFIQSHSEVKVRDKRSKSVVERPKIQKKIDINPVDQKLFKAGKNYYTMKKSGIARNIPNLKKLVELKDDKDPFGILDWRVQKIDRSFNKRFQQRKTKLSKSVEGKNPNERSRNHLRRIHNNMRMKVINDLKDSDYSQYLPFAAAQKIYPREDTVKTYKLPGLELKQDGYQNKEIVQYLMQVKIKNQPPEMKNSTLCTDTKIQINDQSIFDNSAKKSIFEDLDDELTKLSHTLETKHEKHQNSNKKTKLKLNAKSKSMEPHRRNNHSIVSEIFAHKRVKLAPINFCGRTNPAAKPISINIDASKAPDIHMECSGSIWREACKRSWLLGSSSLKKKLSKFVPNYRYKYSPDPKRSEKCQFIWSPRDVKTPAKDLSQGNSIPAVRGIKGNLDLALE